ncbi:MAG: SagB family peptide dehydrogenase, partial [Acidobacteriota bacterium]|nr:SagB family peptide dehydrogenase [Acidobacteriota bacterium]
MLYKRSAAIVAVWESHGAAVRNYVTGGEAQLTPGSLQVLDALRTWQTVDDLATICDGLDRTQIASIVDALARAGVVQCTGRPEHPAETALRDWGRWAPAASLFHLATKDVRFADREVTRALAGGRLLLEPPPVPNPCPPTIQLRTEKDRSQFSQVLRARRTWRRFGSRPITLKELSTLLYLTWGTQAWISPRDDLRFRLKTSPSGGACHCIDVHVVVRNVKGLDPGVYRYHDDDHGLHRVDAPWSAATMAAHLGGQHWVSGAGAVFLMTADFSRVQWKYKFARAYRAVLIEAGHLCQTFCLVATRLKLAPFCTIALADTAIEQALGMDGVSQSVLYAAGVGARPRNAAWAPSPDRSDDPAYEPRSRRR